MRRHIDNYIPLNRQFSPYLKDQEEAETNELHINWGFSVPASWADLDSEYRCVILAEAGAGKTVEFIHRAMVLEESGKFAFFIRIEDITKNFSMAFEVGDEERVKLWLQSTEEAWFFLDSVDEARLDNPSTFEKAIRWFAKIIKPGEQRAHIYISGRTYAWRPTEDQVLLDKNLYLPAVEQEINEVGNQGHPQSALKIYSMRPLDNGRIRTFCTARGASEINLLLEHIERADLRSLATRPFDLEGILAKWEEDRSLGSRLDLFQHNIDLRLRDAHNTDRAQRQSLNLDQARNGARRLSAAVVLTGKAGINVPDAAPSKPGIDAEVVLNEWDPNDVHTLLERGLFNDIIYGAVRFRHREVREYLAAEWFSDLLETGNNRNSIESLFFRRQYGEDIITPRLRPILPWLILFDEETRDRALEISPEIAVEGGDPSWLPLTERKKILADIVQRIASKENVRSAQDHTAVTRIATPDLSEDTQHLINKYSQNDAVIFFLGRLVWQGEMTNCVESLFEIALDESRGIDARKVSARAVMSCGTPELKRDLWQNLNESGVPIPCGMLAELVAEAEPESLSVVLLLDSLLHLDPDRLSRAYNLDGPLRYFIERLSGSGNQPAITKLLDGLHEYLAKPPYIERRACQISSEYAWLITPSIHLVEKLVEAKSPAVRAGAALSIMLMFPCLRRWQIDTPPERKENLRELVAGWPELNDALYWASIDQARSTITVSPGTPFIDDQPVYRIGHFWEFDLDSLPRLLELIRSRPLQDDRLVALSTAFRVYLQADRRADILGLIQEAVSDDPILQQQLDLMLNPPMSEFEIRHKKAHEAHLREQELLNEQRRLNREIWIEELKANPDLLCNPPDLESRDITTDQRRLISELLDHGSTREWSDLANWEALVPEFGQDVARSYREASVNFWRDYTPALRSEGENNGTDLYSRAYAQTGLEIEARENPDFPGCLDENQVKHALRYITWIHINGLPGWTERMYRTFPDLFINAVKHEVVWEFENTGPGEPMHYILFDLAYYTPWLHTAIAPVIMEWVEANPSRIKANGHYCITILANGGIDKARLVEFVKIQIGQGENTNITAWWYAFLVDCAPSIGIPEFGEWLASLDAAVATNAAQFFITTLLGDDRVGRGSPHMGCFRQVDHLRSLYLLMHRYIRVNEDISRAGIDIYSPTLRDDAQSARNRLFSLLADIPGKESYTAISEMARDHPSPISRIWMAKQAYNRAEKDGDLEPWSAEQVSTFFKSQITKPATHRQLFDIAVMQLLDMKILLECGNNSPWRTWQRVIEETEMRTLVASWLKQNSHDRFTIAEEPELANNQRMDIWLNNPVVSSPVPIELKLLDKDWSGTKLCESLRHQLAGGYLREAGASYGVMLLIYQGKKTRQYWIVDNKKVKLEELGSALEKNWMSVADDYPGVDNITVVVIDLTQRE